MRNDIKAVGGFFEDLPVLAFVLTGSFLVIGMNVWVAGQREAHDVLRLLDESAEELADAVVMELTAGGHSVVPLDSVRLLNSSSFLPLHLSLASWTVSLSLIHPAQIPLATWQGGHAPPDSDAGWHSTLFNVLCSRSCVGVAEVVAVVYGNG